MDGLLVVDKPVGPTSHDIVARARRALRERRIGHTGTLDPMASGVLPLVVGRATRLARFLSASDKQYVGTVRLGWSTDTYDALGQRQDDRHTSEAPSRSAIERALDAFRGAFVQQPPAFSAKKIEGRRSYALARAHARAPGDSAAGVVTPNPLPAPVRVMVTQLEILEVSGDLVTLLVVCSAGFYVRSLAHDLGVALGVGGHLTALRRTATSGVTLAQAVSIDEIEAGTAGLERARSALLPLEQMLPALRVIALTTEGTERVAKGRDVGGEHVVGGLAELRGTNSPVRLVDPLGRLLAIGEHTAARELLHPVVVLM